MGKKSQKHGMKEKKPKGGWKKALNLDIDGALRINTSTANRRIEFVPARKGDGWQSGSGGDMLPSHVKVLNPKKKEGASAAGASAGAGAANPSLMAPGARDPEGFVEPERILHRVGALASKWPSKRTLPTGGGLHN
eukprot:gene29338-14651_t